MLKNITGEQRINLTAISVSVLLHVVLFIQLTDTAMSNQAQAPNFSTRISLNLMPPAIQPAQLVKADMPPPEPVRKPKPKPKPESKPQLKPEIVKPESPVIPELATANKVSEQIQRGQINEAAPIKQHYLNNLLTYIEGHKYYPQSARSRGIKGSIDVTFELLNNGEISDLKATGGPMILRKAAEQAIASALPFPVPPSEVNCPLQVSYAMQFELN
ncbi:MAG: energy transducer TonB [Gammaproteobacteria bacterium]|nr:energy transducer TonB [Gammaproteobacteria bacterium]